MQCLGMRPIFGQCWVSSSSGTRAPGRDGVLQTWSADCCSIDSSNFPEQSGIPIRHDWSNSCPLSWTPLGGMILADSPSDSDNAENRVRHQTSEQNDWA
jgi:hypothetical protein